MSALAPLIIGVLFGFLLERARLTRYAQVVGVFRFTDLTLLKFLGSAILGGAVAVQAALSLGLATTVPVMPTHAVANLLGGALLGVAMALAGFCPGTILAGAGAGQLDYLIPGVAGLCTGALAFGYSYASFMPALKQLGRLRALTLPELFGVNGWLVIILLAEVGLVGLYAVERGVGGTSEAPPRASDPDIEAN